MFPKTKDEFLRRMRSLRDVAGFLGPGSPAVEVRDPEGRLHNADGPAYRSASRIIWYNQGKRHGMDADVFGSVVYFWRGVMIPDSYFTGRDKLTIDEILLHPNTEVRAVGLELYGYDRLTSDSRCKIIHRDPKKSSVLFSFHSNNLHEPISFVKVRNSSPEPDGSFRDYYLCVPPSMQTCQEAIAWTFDLHAKEYAPVIET